MKIVMKFGGVSVADGDRLRKVGTIVRRFHNEGHALVVVISAMHSVTDSLIDIAKRASRGDKKSVTDFIEQTHRKHRRAAEASIMGEQILGQTLSAVDARIDELKNILLGVAHIGELTPRSKDFVIGYGEKFSAPILQGVLEDLGIKSKALTGGEAGIVTDDRYGDAGPLMNVTAHQVRQTLEPLLNEGTIPVVSGFVASTQDGVQTTLGRGGSDYTASIIGAALKVDEVWVWKEVDGLMTANPKMVKSARMIEVISFAEAMELAHFGAEVVHPKALECASKYKIPFRVKALRNQDGKGTAIESEVKIKSKDVVKAISNIGDVSLITVSGASMVGTPRLAAKVLQILTDEEVDVLMISQSSSEENITLAVPKAGGAKAQNALELSLLGTKQVREVSVEDGLSIVAVIGAGMRGTPGVAARVFGTMAKGEINIRAIAQGSSELNISFIVKKADAKKAIEALHSDFGLGD
ncbi:MAG: aspartate kinase [Candidatus Thermoplasmatota archaeon]|nr:aspartate kinase [Candidatus Thermoplasmatota archaeon]